MGFVPPNSDSEFISERQWWTSPESTLPIPLSQTPQTTHPLLPPSKLFVAGVIASDCSTGGLASPSQSFTNKFSPPLLHVGLTELHPTKKLFEVRRAKSADCMGQILVGHFLSHPTLLLLACRGSTCDATCHATPNDGWTRSLSSRQIRVPSRCLVPLPSSWQTPIWEPSLSSWKKRSVRMKGGDDTSTTPKTLPNVNARATNRGSTSEVPV